MRLIISGAKLGVVVGSAYIVYTILSGIWLALLTGLTSKNKKGEKKGEVKEESGE